MELFDVSEEKAIYHVSRDGWVIDYDADTDFYYYYDNDASDNTTYIGAVNTTAGGNVWDSNFKAVYHMADATTSTIYDSTSNNNDGTKKGANEPAEATGKVGQGQDFDGTDDYIDTGIDLTDYAAYTVSLCFNRDGKASRDLMAGQDIEGDRVFTLEYEPTWETGTRLDSYNGLNKLTGDDVSNATWINVTVTENDTTHILYQNGVSKNSDTGNIPASSALTLKLGIRDYVGYLDPFDGKEDEVRISSTVRTAGWIAATYDSLWDSLLTYGSEETGGVEDNAIMFGCNF